MLHPSYNDLMNVVNSDVEPGEHPVVNSRIPSYWQPQNVPVSLLPVPSLWYRENIQNLSVLQLKNCPLLQLKLIQKKRHAQREKLLHLLQSRPLQQQKPQILTSRNKRLQRKLQQKKRIPKLK